MNTSKGGAASADSTGAGAAATSSGDLPAYAPRTNSETQPFWDGAAEGVLRLPRCDECERVVWYPRERCDGCGTKSVTWFDASGKGSVYSFTVTHRIPGRWQRAAPFVVAYVELEEGPRVLTNLVDCDPTEVAIGQEVTAVFQPTEEGPPLLRFKPTRSNSQAVIMNTSNLEKVHELTIVSLELGIKAAKEVKSKLTKLSTSEDSDEQAEFTQHKIAGSGNISSSDLFLWNRAKEELGEDLTYDKVELYVRVASTSICFILRGHVSEIDGKPLKCLKVKEVREDIHKRRRCIRNCVLGDCKSDQKDHFRLKKLYSILGKLTKFCGFNRWLQEDASYAFNLYIAEYADDILEDGKIENDQVKALMLALHYFLRDEKSRKDEICPSKVADETLKMYGLSLAPYYDSFVLSSWSSCVLATTSAQMKEKPISPLLDMVLLAQSNLQMFWNKNYFLERNVEGLNTGENSTITLKEHLHLVLEARSEVTTKLRYSTPARLLSEHLQKSNRVSDEIDSLGQQSEILTHKLAIYKARVERILTSVTIIVAVLLPVILSPDSPVFSTSVWLLLIFTTLVVTAISIIIYQLFYTKFRRYIRNVRGRTLKNK